MRDSSSYDYTPFIGVGSRHIRAAAFDTTLDHNVIDELFRFQGCAPVVLRKLVFTAATITKPCYFWHFV